MQLGKKRLFCECDCYPCFARASNFSLTIVHCITRDETQRIQLVWLQPSLRSGSKLQTCCNCCVLFPVMHFILHSNSFENLIWCNCRAGFFAVSTRSTGTENRIFKRGAMKTKLFFSFSHNIIFVQARMNLTLFHACKVGQKSAFFSVGSRGNKTVLKE